MELPPAVFGPLQVPAETKHRGVCSATAAAATRPQELAASRSVSTGTRQAGPSIHGFTVSGGGPWANPQHAGLVRRRIPMSSRGRSDDCWAGVLAAAGDFFPDDARAPLERGAMKSRHHGIGATSAFEQGAMRTFSRARYRVNVRPAAGRPTTRAGWTEEGPGWFQAGRKRVSNNAVPQAYPVMATGPCLARSG